MIQFEKNIAISGTSRDATTTNFSIIPTRNFYPLKWRRISFISQCKSRGLISQQTRYHRRHSYRHSRISSRTVLINNEDRSVWRTGWSLNVRTTTDSHQDLMEKLLLPVRTTWERERERAFARLWPGCSYWFSLSPILPLFLATFFLWQRATGSKKGLYIFYVKIYSQKKSYKEKSLGFVIIFFSLNVFKKSFMIVLIFYFAETILFLLSQILLINISL